MSLTFVEVQEQTEPYQNFINSLKSHETKKAYKTGLFKYLKHYNTTIEGLLANAKVNVSDIEKMIRIIS